MAQPGWQRLFLCFLPCPVHLTHHTPASIYTLFPADMPVLRPYVQKGGFMPLKHETKWSLFSVDCLCQGSDTVMRTVINSAASNLASSSGDTGHLLVPDCCLQGIFVRKLLYLLHIFHCFSLSIFFSGSFVYWMDCLFGFEYMWEYDHDPFPSRPIKFSSQEQKNTSFSKLFILFF